MGTRTEAEWMERGWPQFIAEAFEGREITTDDVADRSISDLMDEVLIWHGVQGYTNQILEAVDYLKTHRSLILGRPAEAHD